MDRIAGTISDRVWGRVSGRILDRVLHRILDMTQEYKPMEYPSSVQFKEITQ